MAIPRSAVARGAAGCAPAGDWWKRPLAILAHAYEPIPREHLADPRALDRLVRWKRSLGFDAEHLLLNGSMLEGGAGGDDPRRYLFKNRHGCAVDFLAHYLPQAKRRGMRVIAYFNVHWFKPGSFPADHFMVDAAGKPKILYGNGNAVCPRGPFRAWAEGLAEDLGEYAIDGVFLDGPLQDRCWCAACRGEFQSRHGAALPANAGGCPPALLPAWTGFPADGAIGFVRAFARGLRKHNPAALLYINDIAGGGDGVVAAGTADVTNFVGAEGGFIGYGPLSNDNPFRPSVEARVLAARARGRSRVIFSDCGYKKYDYHAHPRAEIAWMYAGTVAHGANPWFLIFKHALKTEGVRTALRFNRFIRDHRDALENGESLATAAVIHSPLNVTLAGTVKGGSGDDVAKREGGAAKIAVPRHGDEFIGVCAAFARSGHPFDVLEESNLMETGIPPRIRLLVLPGVGAMADPVAEVLRKFVAGGGRILATFDSSLFDEEGRRRDDYALADVFGARADGPLAGPSRLDYVNAAGRNFLTRGVGQPVLPCSEYWWHIRAASGAVPLLHYHEKMPRRYASLTPASGRPAAIANSFGRGKAVFLPAAVGELYYHYHFPDWRRILLNAAAWLAPAPVSLSAGDDFVETALRRGADGSVALHLINYASGVRPAGRAIPFGPLDARVTVPAGFRTRSVTLAMAGGKTAFRQQGRVVAFTVRRLEEYEMALLRGD
ncbi:MAG: hypothetical protein V1809_09095 [Planctomycetota bacterium]